jgi:hypothetical protein
MKQIVYIFVVTVFWSCTSNQVSNPNPEPAVTPREVDLLEAFEISKSDSQQLVTTWHAFINNMEAQKEKSLDTVECWSAEAFQTGNYSAPDSLSLDACVTQLLIPLKKSKAWPLFMTNDYNVGIQKRQSEQEGRYYISFPRVDDSQSKDHEIKHTFFFKKRKGKYDFGGYVYN